MVMKIEKQPLQEKCAIFQLIHKKWYTQMDIARWDCEKNPICPRCNTVEETFHLHPTPTREH